MLLGGTQLSRSTSEKSVQALAAAAVQQSPRRG